MKKLFMVLLAFVMVFTLVSEFEVSAKKPIKTIEVVKRNEETGESEIELFPVYEEVESTEGLDIGVDDLQIARSGALLIDPMAVATDGRTFVTNTSLTEYRKVVYLEVNFPGQQYPSRCTGAMVDDDLVLTNAHCVYDLAYPYGNNRGWATDVKVMPGKTEGTSPTYPFGWVVTDDIWVAGDWIFSNDLNSDWAIIDLQLYNSGTGIANTGYFGVSKTHHTGMDVKVTGYPGWDSNHPDYGDFDYYQGMYYDYGELGFELNGRVTYKDIVTNRGVSGSPVYDIYDKTIRAIHSWGDLINLVDPSGILVNDDMIDFINLYK